MVEFSDFEFHLQIRVSGLSFIKIFFAKGFDKLLKFWESNDSLVESVCVIRFCRFVTCISDLTELKDFKSNYNRYVIEPVEKDLKENVNGK